MLDRTIGSYRVVRQIGSGGMATVYEAVHGSIGRRVAVKVLRPAYAQDPTIAARLFQEARAVNLVGHPAIVSSIDYGQLPSGSVYIVMEYVAGETLSRRQRRFAGSFGPAALRYARQIADAMAAAHERGVVHRDLKPDNVMLVADREAPGGERVRILDFGIAKVLGPEADSAALQTEPGLVMGSPRYMSPEQCLGSREIDGKADVYSLGVLLFQLLCGRLPFDFADLRDLLKAHVQEPPPPLRELAPDVPPPVAALVEAMLAKEPQARPAMAGVAAELARLEEAVGDRGAAPPGAPWTEARGAGPGAAASLVGDASAASGRPPLPGGDEGPAAAPRRAGSGRGGRWLLPLGGGVLGLCAGLLIALWRLAALPEPLPAVGLRERLLYLEEQGRLWLPLLCAAAGALAGGLLSLYYRRGGRGGRAPTDRVRALRGMALLAGVPRGDLERIARIARWVEHRPGDAVITQGESGDALYLLVSGSARVLVDGREVAHVGPGEPLGEMALFDAAPRSASVVALAPLRALRLGRAEFNQAAAEHPELLQGVARVLAQRLRARNAEAPGPADPPADPTTPES